MDIRSKILGTVADSILTALYSTCRLTVWGQADYERAMAEHGHLLFATWHHELIINPWFYRNHGIDLAVMVSTSKDGNVIAEVLKRNGYLLARGSSNRGGGEAFNTMMEMVADGCSGGITVDGPKGPPYEAKPGIIQIAARTGTPIMPFVLDASPSHEFNSWDRVLLPLPGSRITGTYAAEPLFVPSGLSQEEYDGYRQELTDRLNRLNAQNRLATRMRIDGDPRELELPPDYLKWLPRKPKKD